MESTKGDALAPVRTDAALYASPSSLSPEHNSYLQRRYGTVDLDPLPSADDADPLNWSAWKKNTTMALVAFHAYIAIFTAAAIIPAYVDLSMDLHITVPQASYLTSAQVSSN